MALVRASQLFVMEGYAEVKEKTHLLTQAKYVRKLIKYVAYVDAICDEAQATEILESEIEKMMKKDGWGRNFEGWSSYHKYIKPGELQDYPEGKEFELELDYIRDWKMEKIMKELDGNQFAILCKELGISAGEAIARN